ncbi:MAG: hypothetical protein LLG00_04875 [Planctomycetaceae bacterium]|nr:hypothetical protein [Planctomycetaceae bacterium]
MTSPSRFRVLGTDGRLSQDTFVVSPAQPSVIRPDCLLVVHERSGMMITVHNTRLFPASAVASKPFSHRLTACLRCGRVEGVAQDEVRCPHHGDGPCGLFEPQAGGAD